MPNLSDTALCLVRPVDRLVLGRGSESRARAAGILPQADGAVMSENPYVTAGLQPSVPLVTGGENRETIAALLGSG